MTDPELRQLALNLIHAADTEALLTLLREFYKSLHQPPPQLPHPAPPLYVDKEFVRLRRELLHQQLEDLEKSNPALAAQLQAVIDRYCTQSPFPY